MTNSNLNSSNPKSLLKSLTNHINGLPLVVGGTALTMYILYKCTPPPPNPYFSNNNNSGNEHSSNTTNTTNTTSDKPITF